MSDSIFNNPTFNDPLFNSEHDPWATDVNDEPQPTSGLPSQSIFSSNESNWGGYNSNDILHRETDHLKTSVSLLSEEQEDPLNILNSDNIESISRINLKTDLKKKGEELEVEVEEEDFSRPLESSIWSETEIDNFNPLSFKNSDDKIIVRVREIPEKEGLVFKHINYLITHNLKFNSEYYIQNGNENENENNNLNTNTNGNNSNKKPNESKIIRRYSDFAWLVEILWEKYPFRLIPELPPKKFASSSNDPLFLQKRRRGLQRFLYQLIKHPILSKESLIVMFLTVPNDFSNWKKFANIESTDELDGIRVNIPRRFRINLDSVLKGLKDNESDIEEEENFNDEECESGSNRNESIINNINQIWNESPVNYKSIDFTENFHKLNDNLTKIADVWSKLYLLIERIEKRELALALDHQRFSIYLQNLLSVDDSVYGLDNLIENRKRQTDDESQNLNIINTIMKQVIKFFQNSKKLKDDEMNVINSDILENFKKFQDYLISLHFLMERLINYKTESEKNIQALLHKIIKTNERIIQIKNKSDIKGSEVDKYVTILVTSVEQLNLLMSRIILVKATFINEFKLFQKTKYIISEIFQDWFLERSKYMDLQQESIQRLFNELQDLPLK